MNEIKILIRWLWADEPKCSYHGAEFPLDGSPSHQNDYYFSDCSLDGMERVLYCEECASLKPKHKPDAFRCNPPWIADICELEGLLLSGVPLPVEVQRAPTAAREDQPRFRQPATCKHLVIERQHLRVRSATIIGAPPLETFHQSPYGCRRSKLCPSFLFQPPTGCPAVIQTSAPHKSTPSRSAFYHHHHPPSAVS